MRKNLMTGVAEYREKYSNDQSFKPLTEEVRNDMTMRATELGLKSWDRDVNRFIDSTRIEQYDPVNTWLDYQGIGSQSAHQSASLGEVSEDVAHRYGGPVARER